nr:MAG TPA: hypothetical protein [Caudoviricetes sp.]
MLYTRHWQWVCSQNGIDGSNPSLAISLSKISKRHFFNTFSTPDKLTDLAQTNPVNNKL